MTTLQQTTRVLVVDDESDFANSMALLLRKHGYDSQVCVDSRDCISILEKWEPEVILLDLAMPGITGLDIARTIQETPDLRPACLIAVTACGQDLDRVQTKLCGFDHHLLKPVDFNQLQRILESKLV